MLLILHLEFIFSNIHYNKNILKRKIKAIDSFIIEIAVTYIRLLGHLECVQDAHVSRTRSGDRNME